MELPEAIARSNRDMLKSVGDTIIRRVFMKCTLIGGNLGIVLGGISMRSFGQTHRQTIFLTLIAALFGTGFAPFAMAAETEFDGDFEQAALQEKQYLTQMEDEENRMGPYRDAYLKQLDSLEKLTHSSRLAHGKNPKINAQISSLTYWLKQEDEREQSEMTSLNNLDHWRKYWESKRNVSLRTQAWNQEQVEIDQRLAAQKEIEAKAQADRRDRYQSLADSKNRNFYNNDRGSREHYTKPLTIHIKGHL